MATKYEEHVPEKLVWSVSDYRYGVVSLYEKERFHIFEHHPELKNNENAIKETIADPDIVFPDADYPNRQLFVKSETSASFSPQFKVRTVIEYDDKTLATGYVVTAIKVKNEGGKGEKPIYTKQEKNDI